MSFEISREQYAGMFGPTTGDSIRLGDTNLFAKIEKDMTVYGDESKFGGGKCLRDGMGQSATELRRDNPKVVDLIITSAVILDYTGIYKADIGIRDGKIVAIGKGGNPSIMDNVDFIVGASTEALSGEGLIVTAGGIDTHVHFITPAIAYSALENGTTTIIGGGTGPADGTNSATSTPGAWNIHQMLRAAEGMPVNMGIQGKAGGAIMDTTAEQIEAGAMALKVHEDWGATLSCIDHALETADKYDVQVSLHSDTLNETGFVEDTIKSIGGRCIHSYHTEGAGGGHAPDLMKVASKNNIIPSSTSPTNPYTVDTLPEHLDMLMVCHHLDPKIPEDVAFADSRIRKQTIAAEDVLQDMGALSIMSSDTMAMGRIGEVIMRSWQLADKMKKQRGPLEGDSEYIDNNRIKRYVAKYTINPAIAEGISDYIGSIEVGKYADLVLWEPAMFGAKPKMILKSGMIAYGVMGDSNASIPTTQPRTMRELFGLTGKARQHVNMTFVSTYAYEHGIKEELGLERNVLPVHNVRNITKKDMKFNSETPKIEIDPQTYDVTVDGKLITCEPARELPLAQRYFIY
ncbi:urease subunit alpha [Clostridium perfringens]|nr:urease subunit alpha [Clostridium perfringens]MDK0712619.1 urease subunit alpha [Clostridium perfringens]